MADKTIGQLTAATQLNDQDLLVLEQGGTAKKMAGSVLKQYVVGQGGIDHITLNADYTLTVTYTSGQSWTSGSIRGQQGAQGIPGQDGEDGVGIASVAKTGTSGLIDTYTITFTDGTTFTFQITNGEDGATGPQGATGNGIDSITKIGGTGAPGTTDTYRITSTNGNHFDFNVYNGADGSGAVVSVNGKTGTVVLDADDVNAAPAWQSSATYAAGAYCIHNGYLWHNTSGASSTNVEPGTNYNVWNVTYSNENLLDNPWFTVNQRGQTAYTGAVYGFDRWKGSREFVKAEQNANGVLITGESASGVNAIVQVIDNSIKVGQTVTLSCLLQAIDDECGVRLAKNDGIVPTYSYLHVPAGESLAYYAITFTAEEELPLIQIRPTNLCSAIVKAVKLELGSVSTLANDTAPNYAEELAKCQRHFQIFKTSSLRKTDKDDFRPTMRVNPSNSTISIGGTTYYTSSADL